jgi:predicted dehydrogenase
VVTGEKVRLGVVGCGLIAQLVHLPTLAALSERFDVVAVADPSRRTRAAIAARHGIGRAYERHEELLERAAVDAVLVASPNATHAQVTLDALAAGAHVLVEKPLCLTVADADRIVEVASLARRVVQVGYMKRFDAAYEALRDDLPGGVLRHVASITVDPGIGDRYRPPGFVPATDVARPVRDALARATAEQVAAAVGDDDPRHVGPFSDAFLGALVHDVNLVLGLDLDVGPVLDAAAAPDGSLAYGACEIGGPARWTAAWMLLPGAASFREDVRVFASGGVRTLTLDAPYELPGADSYRRQLAHFHDCVSDGVACRTPAAQGRRDVALLTEMYRTAVSA